MDAEATRLLAPLDVEDGLDWREVNMAVAKAMQNYCGGVKCDDLLRQGLALLEAIEQEELPRISCRNPHELMRAHEVADIITVAKLILHACLLRKCDSKPLSFVRSDSDGTKAEAETCFLTIRQEDGQIIGGQVPHDYYGDLRTEYEKHNADYLAERSAQI